MYRAKKLATSGSIQVRGGRFFRGVAAIQRQMRQDQRAWMQASINRLHVTSILQPSSTLFSEIHIVNVGKSPAKAVIACVIVTVVKTGQDPHGMDDVCSRMRILLFQRRKCFWTAPLSPRASVSQSPAVQLLSAIALLRGLPDRSYQLLMLFGSDSFRITFSTCLREFRPHATG